MTRYQKAITPSMSDAYLRLGYDRVAGFAVPVADVTWATTPADLHAVHALGFEASPFSADDAYVDVLRFTPGPQVRTADAVGGTDATAREARGGTFIDRPPFTGTGFAPVEGHRVPVTWIVHSRVPAGSELVRVHADGTEQVLARYVDVARCWEPVDATVHHTTFPGVSRFVGALAEWKATHLNAEVHGDHVVLVSEHEPHGAFEFTQAASGRWFREVPRADVDKLYELFITGRWRGVEVRLVDLGVDEGGDKRATISSVGHDADAAEAAGMVKVDAGVYEMVVDPDELTDLTPYELVPAAWG